LIRIEAKTKKLIYIKSILVDGTKEKFVINSVSNYSKDTLLLNTRTKGILKYATKTNKAISFLKNEAFNYLNVSTSVIYQIENQNFLVLGTKGQGLIFINLKTRQSYQSVFDFNNPLGILSNDINAIELDKNQGIWIASSAGISYFHPSIQKDKYHFFHNDLNIKQASLINCVQKLNQNEYLIGTESDGLIFYNSEKRKTTKIAFSQEINVTSFLKIEHEKILIGTNNGLHLYDSRTKKVSKFAIQKELDQQLILNVKQLNRNKIAICSNGGVLVYNLFLREISYSELGSKNVKPFCKDAFLNGSELYVLRFFDGIEKINLITKKKENITPKKLIGQAINYNNFALHSGKLVISTSSGIIIQDLKNVNKKQFLTSKDGLEGDMIENIVYLPSGKLLYTTTIGLYEHDLLKKKSILLQGFENYVQKWYNQLAIEDGIVTYSISNYFMLHDTQLKFKNTQTPSLNISEIKVEGKKRESTSNLESLAYDENNIELKLASLVFPGAMDSKWYYKLSPIDKSYEVARDGWIELNNLPPNSYQLEFFSVNNQGVKSRITRNIKINISQPFYNTWWFYLINLLFLFSIILIFYQYKKKQIVRLNNVRNQISRDLHDELGANVSSINIMSKILLKKSAENEQVVRNISKYAVEINNTINDIIWNINPKFDSFNELILKMTRLASETLESTAISYEINLPEKNKLEQVIPINNEIKYHLFLIFKEGLNNAIKYSEAKKIEIQFEIERNYFQFVLKDYGIGFELSKDMSGNGLNNMNMRAQEIGASLLINSFPNQGTELTLNIKLK
jgi:ligand-binding sensor domain-containing protein